LRALVYLLSPSASLREAEGDRRYTKAQMVALRALVYYLLSPSASLREAEGDRRYTRARNVNCRPITLLISLHTTEI